MFKKILIPLDGSALSEKALEYTAMLANCAAAEVVLLRVVNPTGSAELPGLAARAATTPGDFLGPQYYTPRPAEENREFAEAEAYLHSLRTRWFNANTPVTTRTSAGAAPEAILEVAEALGVDLIVMSTHGRTGLNRLLYGSVAEAVLRAAHMPVLLIPTKQ